MQKHTIINYLIQKYSYQSYLEIGTHEKDCFNRIVCGHKTCVDPAKNSQTYDYNMTSDDFFKENASTFDIIFIDGLHLAEQVEKDIENSLLILNNNGRIILHDTNPESEFHCLEQHYAKSPVFPAWNGTVWKTVFKYRTNRPELYIATHPDDHGVTVISQGRTNKPINILNTYYSYYIFNAYRNDILNFTTDLDQL